MVKRYILDLDLSPEKRWEIIFNDYKHKIPELKSQVNKIFETFGLGYYSQTFLYYFIKMFEYSGYMAYSKEIRFFSEFSGIDFEKVVIMQLYYEMTAACTSLVTKVNGEPVFFRTMDWDFELLKELTIELDVRKNNQTKFLATTWVGCVGLYTLTIPNKYSLAINYRRTKDINIKSVLYNAFRTMIMCWPSSYLLRFIAENDLNNNELHHILSKAYLISPTYITVCFHDKNLKPAIYTRNINNLDSLYTNDFVIQTNCDHNKDEPNILCSLERRSLAEKIIKKNKNNFKSVEDVFKNFNVYPIINDETIYITLISHENNKVNYKTIINK